MVVGDGVGVLVDLNGSNVCLLLLEDKGVLLEDIGVFDVDIGVLEDDKGVLVDDIGVLEIATGVLDDVTGVLTEFVFDAIIFKTGVFGVFILEAGGFLILGIFLIFCILAVFQS